MDQQDKTLRIGAFALVCAVVLRLSSVGFFQPAADFLARPEVNAWIWYLATGIRVSGEVPALPVFFRESPEPDFAQPGTEVPPVSPETSPLPGFSASDVDLIKMKYSCTLRPDLGALLTRPLTWDLTGDDPTVLILHTHATESYTPAAGEEYTQSAAFRTLDEEHNMVSIGARLAECLTKYGIGVIRDTGLHDYPSYNGSYEDARKAVADYLAQYPTIRLVLDLHRDASGDLEHQMRTSATVDGQKSAQLMLVMGTDESGQSHPNWQENLALGLKLQVILEQKYPGLCRPVNLRPYRFNQDESPGALLIEVGAAGNTHAEALTAVEALAEGITALAKGTADSTPSPGGTG